MSAERYHPVAAILHWTIAALIIGQILGGLYMHGLPNSSPIKFDLYQLHKSFGLTVLFLSLGRLGWRLSHETPPLPAGMPGWLKILARLTHWAFYALMILTPLAGWAIVSVSPTDIPTKWFGLIPVPHLPFFGSVEDREAAEQLFAEQHEVLAKIIIGLLILHVGAALKHVFVDKDGVFQSMLPENRRAWLAVASVFAVLGAASLFYLTAGQAPPSARSNNAGTQGAASGNWVVDYDNSALFFIGSENGNEFRGEFEAFEADIVFDPDNLDGAKILVTVSTGSARTGDPLRDSNLPGSEWFDVKDHPEAVFESTDVRSAEEGYVADGTLVIKDAERPVTLEFDLTIDGDEAHATGHANLVRTNFNLGENASWLEQEGIALEVRVEFEINAVRKD